MAENQSPWNALAGLFPPPGAAPAAPDPLAALGAKLDSILAALNGQSDAIATQNTILQATLDALAGQQWAQAQTPQVASAGPARSYGNVFKDPSIFLDANRNQYYRVRGVLTLAARTIIPATTTIVAAPTPALFSYPVLLARFSVVGITVDIGDWVTQQIAINGVELAGSLPLVGYPTIPGVFVPVTGMKLTADLLGLGKPIFCDATVVVGPQVIINHDSNSHTFLQVFEFQILEKISADLAATYEGA